MFTRRSYLVLLLQFLLVQASVSQVTCPYNIDFEGGDFYQWECSYGRVSTPGGINEITWLGYGVEPTQHVIINSTDTSKDEYGGFPKLCPNGSGYSVKLGNDRTGAQAEGVAYTFSIPSQVTNYSIFFYYAVVLEDPNHLTEQQPRFRAKILNLTDGTTLDCVNFDFTASASLPGFQLSTVKPGVIYKDWTPITLNLTAYAGKTLKLEFISSDCTLQGHFGYAYVDVSSSCNGAISGATICEGDNTGTLVAPFGFESYTWYSDATFATVLSNTQVLFLNPAPPVGTTYPVVVVPYPGFGCQDTVYATISTSPKPLAFAGPDQVVCTYDRIQLGKPPDPGLRYEWTPRTQVSNPSVSNPYTQPGLMDPTTFMVKVTDPQTGCFAEDMVVVTPVIIDTSLLVSGDLVYCKNNPVNALFQIVTPGEMIRWYENNQVIPGATGIQYAPVTTSTSSYFAVIGRQGCIDSTRSVIVQFPPGPNASFRPERTVQCSQVPVKFINQSIIAGNETMTYIWRLQDGSETTTTDLNTVFMSGGIYGITLKATSALGCEDSVTQLFEISDNCRVDIPTAFTPNNDGLNDIFKPALNGIKNLRRFAIFDRWGNMVFSTNMIEEGWNGKNKGVPLDSGMFVWIIEYDAYDRDHIIRKGTVMLIR